MEPKKRVEDKLKEILDNADDFNYFQTDVFNQIMQLIPQWKVFSEDCKPEVGSQIVLKNPSGKYVFHGTWRGNQYDIDLHTELKYQFLQLPD